jgi:4-oxalocrotonate tautomerase family enzyme
MPFVRISMFPRPQEVKKALAKELTEVISKHCKITADHTWIVFEDVPKEHWSRGGILASDER